MPYKYWLLLFFLPLVVFQSCKRSFTEVEVGWPEVKAESKPWTRWWWMGSAVDKENITAQLEAFSQAGIGGVEITPIYGVKGEEERFIDFLSPQWMEMLEYTVEEARRLGLKVDMNQGTGWPFGGPQIAPGEAASRLHVQKYTLEAGQRLSDTIRMDDRQQWEMGEAVHLQILTAYNDRGDSEDLMDYVDEKGILDWTAGRGTWEIYAAFCSKTMQKVKRAAPGGHGWVADHLSFQAVNAYLSRFDTAFGGDNPGIRAMFNDSYEVYDANWTPAFLEEFNNRRGYDLKPYLRDLLSTEDEDKTRRIKSDYRETMSDLLLESFTQQWSQWAHDHGMIVKNQAHGSPGNLLDLYGTVDIPECETFGISKFLIPGLRREEGFIRTQEDPDPVMLKFSSSAAHITGKPLVSAESLTWLAEHFRVSLSQCKPELDQLFLSGINHVFFHGSTYSPVNATWPGWLFYASVHFGPTNTFWHDIQAFNQYITRCQSLLQEGQPDNDVLIYWPIYDIWEDPAFEKLEYQISIHNLHDWLFDTEFYIVTNQLAAMGWQSDFISDRLLKQAEVIDGKIRIGNAGYKALVIPALGKLPVKTLERIIYLAEEGADVIIQDLDMDVPGFHDHQQREKALDSQLNELEFMPAGDELKVAFWGEGRVVLHRKVVEGLKYLGVTHENIQEYGLRFIRIRHDSGNTYFVANLGGQPVQGSIPLNVEAASAVLMDPLSGTIGRVPIERQEGGVSLGIDLEPGQSVFIKTYRSKVAANKLFRQFQELEPVALQGPWTDVLCAGRSCNS